MVLFDLITNFEWSVIEPLLPNKIPCVEITSPDDSLLAKLFADCQLSISQYGLAYPVPRMERSFAVASYLAVEADRMVLSAHRMIAIPLLRSVLENPIPETEE